MYLYLGAMVETTLKSYDPLAYYVNNIEDLDRSVCHAHITKDTAKISELTSKREHNFDVYICVNSHAHAFVLCAPVGNPGDPFVDMLTDDITQIPGLTLCWKFELCYENIELKTYKIKKEFQLFKDFERQIKYSYHIGRYKETSPNALQFAAIRAAPHRYNVLLNDCVEFAKEFCVCMLSYCGNWKAMEEEVTSKIRQASATGLSIERLSRNVRSSGLLGNSLLGGIDFSALRSRLGNRGLILLVLFILWLLFIYPIVVALVVVYTLK